MFWSILSICKHECLSNRVEDQKRWMADEWDQVDETEVRRKGGGDS